MRSLTLKRLEKSTFFNSSNVLSFNKNGPNCSSFCFENEVLVSKRRVSFKTVYFYRPEANAN